MARVKREPLTGVTRSVRLPRNVDAWFVERYERDRERSASELLVSLIHGGLRLREGYMAIHRRELERYALSHDDEAYATYLRALVDTFGPQYVAHLERWLEADGVVAREPVPVDIVDI